MCCGVSFLLLHPMFNILNFVSRKGIRTNSQRRNFAFLSMTWIWWKTTVIPISCSTGENELLWGEQHVLNLAFPSYSSFSLCDHVITWLVHCAALHLFNPCTMPSHSSCSSLTTVFVRLDFPNDLIRWLLHCCCRRLVRGRREERWGENESKPSSTR